MLRRSQAALPWRRHMDAEIRKKVLTLHVVGRNR